MTIGGLRLTFAAMLLAALAGCQSNSGPPPIVLGHVGNLSGIDAAGKHAQQGINLALKEAADGNIAEALEGRPLHVRHTDTRGQLDAYEAEAVRLVSVNRIAGLIGGRTPDQVQGLDRGHVAVVALCGVRPPGVSDRVFAIGMRPAQQAFVLAKYAAEDLKLGQVVMLADERREEFVGVADAFGRHLTQLRPGKAKTRLIRFGKDAKWDELAKQLGEQKLSGAVLFAGTARDWQELRRIQAITVPLLFAGDDGDAANLEPGAAGEAIYFATAFAADPAAPRTQAFIKKYQEGFKAEPDVAAALGYEALQMYVAALKAISPTFTTEKLTAALRGTKEFPGLAGTLAMTPEQYVGRPLYVVRRIGTTLAIQKRYESAALP